MICAFVPCDSDDRRNGLVVPPERERMCGAWAGRSFWLTAPILFFFALLLGGSPAWSQDIKLTSASGGLLISGAASPFRTGFGNVNGLGVGTASSGLTVISSGVTGGVLYTTPYNMVISGAGAGNPVAVSVVLVPNFSHPSTLALKSCYPSSSCSSAAAYTPISTTFGSPTVVIPAPGIPNNITVTGSLGLFVSSANGAGTFTGSDSATLLFLVYDANGMALKSIKSLRLNSPSENVQSAVQLVLATASGGLAISPASDFSINYGNVNGIGIGPASGLSVVSAGGGVIYTTPYLLQPTFSGQSSSTSSLSVYVSTAFVHPTILKLEDAATSSGPYGAISLTSSSPTALTTSASSGSTMTRQLGLFVSNVNGATASRGTDNATLTYTITAP